MNKGALDLAKKATKHLYKVSPRWVKGGCSDISEIIASFLMSRGYQAEAVYGRSRKGDGKPFSHAWLEIEGHVFDPVLWAQKRPLKSYFYQSDESVRQEFEAGICALHADIDPDALAELESTFPA